MGVHGRLVGSADFKSVVPGRKVREVGSIPTRPRQIKYVPQKTLDIIYIFYEIQFNR